MRESELLRIYRPLYEYLDGLNIYGGARQVGGSPARKYRKGPPSGRGVQGNDALFGGAGQRGEDGVP